MNVCVHTVIITFNLTKVRRGFDIIYGFSYLGYGLLHFLLGLIYKLSLNINFCSVR